MSRLWPLALFALATTPWWGRLVATLLADLRDAAEDATLPSDERARTRTRLAPALLPEGRVPVNRVLAFQGIEHRVAARRRWQAGFGRRGL